MNKTPTASKFTNQGAQGDMLLTRIDQLPPMADVHQLKPTQGDVHIVTHSETGHHHVVEAAHVDFYAAANDPFVSYLHVKKVTQLRHLRDDDTHLPVQLDPGIFRVNRQREYTPQGFRQVQD